MDLVVSFELEGRHYWPGAIKPYTDFGAPHRHLFKFIVVVPIPSSRAVELFELRSALIDHIRTMYDVEAGIIDFGGSSCEDIALALCTSIIDNGVCHCKAITKIFVGEEWFLGALL